MKYAACVRRWEVFGTSATDLRGAESGYAPDGCAVAIKRRASGDVTGGSPARNAGAKPFAGFLRESSGFPAIQAVRPTTAGGVTPLLPVPGTVGRWCNPDQAVRGTGGTPFRRKLSVWSTAKTSFSDDHSVSCTAEIAFHDDFPCEARHFLGIIPKNSVHCTAIFASNAKNSVRGTAPAAFHDKNSVRLTDFGRGSPSLTLRCS